MLGINQEITKRELTATVDEDSNIGYIRKTALGNVTGWMTSRDTFSPVISLIDHVNGMPCCRN